MRRGPRRGPAAHGRTEILAVLTARCAPCRVSRAALPPVTPAPAGYEAGSLTTTAVNQTRSPAWTRNARSGPTSSTQRRARDVPIQNPFLVTVSTTVTPEAVTARPASDFSDPPASA